MARSGQGAGEPPRARAAAGSSGPAPRPRAPGRSHNVALGLVALGLVRHALRSRRFYERAAVAAVALASLRGIGQENRASTMARLAAWNKREIQRLEHKAEREVRAVKGAGQMAHPGPPRGLTGADHQTS
jgi:hypothetical protein